MKQLKVNIFPIIFLLYKMKHIWKKLFLFPYENYFCQFHESDHRALGTEMEGKEERKGLRERVGVRKRNRRHD